MKNWWNLNNPYEYRNENLKKLGFKNYQSYLRSELWKSIRSRVLQNAKFRCIRCRKKATQVHHRAYDMATLRGDELSALTAVCDRCHKKAEHTKPERDDHLGLNGYQRLQRANAMLTRRKKKNRHGPNYRPVVDPRAEYAPFWDQYWKAGR